jgi:RNA polymerase sigma factor (sigma-70 family)
LRNLARRIIKIGAYEPEPRLNNGLQTLLERDGPRLLALLTRLTLRQDVAHELFQQLFTQLGGSEGFRKATNAPAYATRVAVNLAFEWRRTQGRRKSASLEADPPGEAPDPLDRLIDVEQTEAILAAMQDLPDLTRDAMVLRFIEALSYDECAARMHKTAQQIRGLCHAGVRQIRARLAPNEAQSLRQVRHE